MTEIASINNGLNAAGVRAPLYWFHDQGFFEEFLGSKKGDFDLKGFLVQARFLRSKTAPEPAKIDKSQTGSKSMMNREYFSDH